MAEALPHENRDVSDLEGSVQLLHSDEQDPFRALRFLIPSRLEGKWGAVDWKAGSLADARHILINVPKNTSINELNPQKIYDQEIAESLTPCLKTNCRHGKTSWGMGAEFLKPLCD